MLTRDLDTATGLAAGGQNMTASPGCAALNRTTVLKINVDNAF